MKCPHCNHEGKALVSETRVFQGDVYRRRYCGACGHHFITQEVGRSDLKMPSEVVSGKSRGNVKSKAVKAAEFDTKALQSVWH